MANATITGTASNFGSISGVLAGEAGTVAGTITGTVSGTLTGSVGVPGAGVPSGGTTGQVLKKVSNTDYDTTWGTDLASAAWGTITGTITDQTDLTAYVAAQLAGGTAVAKNLEVYVRNQSGATLTAGTIVYIDGATGNRPTVTKAQANNDANSAQTFGFIKENIANNGFGYVIVRGELENVDTSALTEGQQLYLSPTTAGTWTTTKPYAPDHLVYVGICVRTHPTQGVILVAIQNGYELNELHDVKITSVSNGQVLKYDSAQGLWVNGTDSSGVAWGGITGTLSAQTDLQTALDSKLSNTGGTIADSSTVSFLSSATDSTIVIGAGEVKIESNTLATDYSSVLYNSVTVFDVDGSTMHTATGIVFPDATFQSTAFIPADYLSKAGNLSGLADTSAARSNLGLGTMATETASDYSTTTVANGLYYPLSSNPAGYLTSAPVTSVAGKTGAVTLTNTDISGLGTMATATATDYLAKAGNLSGLADLATSRSNLGLGTMATETASNYLTTSAASSTYAPLASPALTGTPTAPTAAVDTNTTQVATTAYVIGQGYLKSATASSTYAPLASPALTGTPTAPTASAGTNTTQIATTAFVQQEVPAASTSTAGKVQLATFTTPSPTSTSTAVTPRVAMDLMMHPGFIEWGTRGSSATSGAGATLFTYSTRVTEILGPNAATAGYAMAIWDTSGTGMGMLNMTRGVNGASRKWNSPIWASGRGQHGWPGSTSYNGDANCTVRVSVGGKSSAGSGNISVNDPGFGFYYVPGSAMVLQVSKGDGSSLTNVTSSFTPVVRESFDWKIYSDGAGNVTLYVNDSQVATTTAGPSTSSAEASNFYFEMVEQTASAAARIIWMSVGPKIYWGV